MKQLSTKSGNHALNWQCANLPYRHNKPAKAPAAQDAGKVRTAAGEAAKLYQVPIMATSTRDAKRQETEQRRKAYKHDRRKWAAIFGACYLTFITGASVVIWYGVEWWLV